MYDEELAAAVRTIRTLTAELDALKADRDADCAAVGSVRAVNREFRQERDALKAQLAAARQEVFEICANWLRRNANAETDIKARAAFVEAHNAIRQLAADEIEAKSKDAEESPLGTAQT
jgi:FtsZ-binding cell division protein ZapB